MPQKVDFSLNSEKQRVMCFKKTVPGIKTTRHNEKSCQK